MLQLSVRHYSISLNGKTYDLEVIKELADVFLVTVDDVSFEVSIGSAGNVVSVEAGRRRRMRRPALNQRPSSDLNAKDGVVRAVMPGRVIAVNVSTGDKVTKGQALAVIESMKMENTVTSPLDGVIGSVSIEEGETVLHGQTLLEFE